MNQNAKSIKDFVIQQITNPKNNVNFKEYTTKDYREVEKYSVWEPVMYGEEYVCWTRFMDSNKKVVSEGLYIHANKQDKIVAVIGWNGKIIDDMSKEDISELWTLLKSEYIKRVQNSKMAESVNTKGSK